MAFFRLILVLPLIIFVLVAVGCNEVDLDEGKIKRIIVSGNEIVDAIDRYKISRNNLPSSLEELVSAGFLDSIPDSGIEGRKFRYVRFHPVEDMEYRVSLALSTPSIVSNSITEVTYKSDSKYEGDNVEIHKLVDGWAVQTVYRAGK